MHIIVLRSNKNIFKILDLKINSFLLTKEKVCDKIHLLLGFILFGRSSLWFTVRECAVGESTSEMQVKVAQSISGRTALCLLEPDGEHRYMRK